MLGRPPGSVKRTKVHVPSVTTPAKPRVNTGAVDPLFCTAIARRQLLIFGYADAVRIVEPHVYGRNTAGHDALSAWLRPGQSRVDPDGGWRMYLIDGLVSPQLLPEVFAAPREGYNPDDPHFETIYCRLDPSGPGR